MGSSVAMGTNATRATEFVCEQQGTKRSSAFMFIFVAEKCVLFVENKIVNFFRVMFAFEFVHGL
jgi:hypothetical protein